MLDDPVRELSARGSARGIADVARVERAVKIADHCAVATNLVEAVHDRSVGDAGADHARGQRHPYRRVPCLPDDQQRTRDDPGLDLEFGRQQQRRGDADQQGANGPARRNHQVEAGQMTRAGLKARELAMAEHADREQTRGEHRQRDHQVERQLNVAVHPHHCDQHGKDRHMEQRSPVPAASFHCLETEDERDQVER